MSLVHGVDSSQILRPLLVDGAGKPLVTATLAAGSALIGDVQARELGYINGAWHTMPMPDGYSDTWEETVTVVATAATQSVNGTACPAGEKWDVQIVNVFDATTAPGSIRVWLQGGATAPNFAVNLSPGMSLINGLVWSGRVTVPPGTALYAQLTGVTIGDSIGLRYHAVRTYLNL